MKASETRELSLMGSAYTSNQFTFNGVNANNLFNGNSTSNISDSRFTLNTGEIFGVGGQVQTNTSVFDAIGQALPTPPTETIQEVHVTTSMYDASMGSASGAHIETTTKSGTNNLHGQLYEYFQNNVFDAQPTFLTPNPFFTGAPPLHRNVFGGTLGGPIKKDKLFFFGSYQGQRISDALSGAFNGVPTLQGLTDTNRRSPESGESGELQRRPLSHPRRCVYSHVEDQLRHARQYRSRGVFDHSGKNERRSLYHSFVQRHYSRKWQPAFQLLLERPTEPIQRRSGQWQRRLRF